MSENKMSDIIKTSLEGIKSFTDMETAIGSPIHTASGVTVIPVSKVTVGFVSGGVDYVNKKLQSGGNFGGGGGTGISITPLAFLTVSQNGDINLISLSDSETSVDKVVSLIEHAPELIEKIRGALS